MGTYSFSGSIQKVTVSKSGTYDITAYGAQGGNGSGEAGGSGAKYGGDFNLTAGEKLEIVTGGAGAAGSSGGGGGGGGGSFVLANTGAGGSYQLLLAAGGGGGGAMASNGGAGGYSGAGEGFGGGETSGDSGGGAGHQGDGGNSGGGTNITGGYGGGLGGKGQFGTGPGGNGGFGGGGAGGPAYGAIKGGGGGGGGYSGGQGGSEAGGYGGAGGSGGTSFDAAGAPLVAGSAAAENAANNGNGLVEIVCYCQGTEIATPSGQARVERLKIGDKITTRFGGVQSIKWIGRQTFEADEISPDRYPVRIRAGAIATGVPSRDLFVSPGHSMLIGKHLVPARKLVNEITITQDDVTATVNYYQIELETHDCVLAEGAWSETYADAPGWRQNFHNAHEFHALYPDHVAPAEARLCASRPEEGPEFAAALTPTAARAFARLRPGRLIGYVDAIRPDEIQGWAMHSDRSTLPVIVEAVLDGEPIGSVLAIDWRGDLEAAGLREGFCAFAIKLSGTLDTKRMARVSIRRAGDGALLPMSEDCVGQIDKSVAMPVVTWPEERPLNVSPALATVC